MDTDTWFAEFRLRHESARNPGIYWMSLVALLVGITGLLWALPVPEAFVRISPLLNFGSAFLMAALVYYFVMSLSLGIGMVPFVLGVAAIEGWIQGLAISQSYAASVLIGAGISGLCFGHYSSGGLRAVGRDVQLIMIGPAWLLALLYRRLGIPL